ncbi:MAG: hypothetical protein J6J60_04460 [Clostridia bacterium]|nr:hypothetical protein [Clostridia bacterium]
MANSSLGIYIDNGLIKYAKLQRDKDNVKIEAFNVVFYDNLERELNKIVSETGSSRIPICVNLSNEMYNYFEVISLMQKRDRAQSIKIDFETLCDEKGLSASDLEARYLLKESETNSDKLTAIHVSVEKDEISKIANALVGKKVTSVRPITTSIINLLELDDKENIVIVNLEKETKVTTIVDGMISRIDTLQSGMKDILSAINETENSERKAYEVCKNTTIYTQGTDVLDSDENEHLEEIMPVLYNIVQQTKEIIEDCPSTIHKIYITGLGSAINNIDLYFQEYAVNSKCEILKPFFLENTTMNTSFKDYIEVNSAIALALDDLGFCAVGDDFNFKKGNSSFDLKSLTANRNLNPEININMNMSGPLDLVEKVFIRINVILIIALVLYQFFSNGVLNQIGDMESEVDSKIASVTREITKVESDIKIIQDQADHYAQVSEVLKKLEEENQEILDAVPEISYLAIPTMLNNITKVMPIDVTMLSLKNTEGRHIVIEVVAPDYDQIGFFKALISTNGILRNVKSSSGEKIKGYVESPSGEDEEWVYVTIEGDLLTPEDIAKEEAKAIEGGEQ